jgi:hypothetical protein
VSKSPSNSIIEWITIRLPKILSNGEDLHVVSVYNPPSTEITKETFSAIVNNVNTIVAGDLNAHNSLWGSSDTDPYESTLETLVSELDEVADQLKTNIMEAIDKSTSTVNVKSYQTQILPRRIVALIKEKRRLQRSLIATRSPETTRQINQLSEQNKKQVAEHKKDKWREFCSELNQHRSSDSVLWRKISSIENANTQKPPRCPVLKLEDEFVTTPH